MVYLRIFETMFFLRLHLECFSTLRMTHSNRSLVTHSKCVFFLLGRPGRHSNFESVAIYIYICI